MRTSCYYFLNNYTRSGLAACGLRSGMRSHCRNAFLIWCLLMMFPGDGKSEVLQVASLNPVVSDFARQVGGPHVQVVDLMPLGSNPHRFYPSPDSLKAASKADLVLAAGKGLELYLDEFRESLAVQVPVFEVGDAVPSLTIKASPVFVCCPSHASDSADPHWWHSVKNADRAARAIAREFARLDPAHAEAYGENAGAYAQRLEALSAWVRKEVSKVPLGDRELTTAHSAFGYFCREFGFRAVAVQGLTTEDDPDPGHLKKVVETVRSENIRAVFPEEGSNPSVMVNMLSGTGVRVGAALYASALPREEPTYEAMIRHNVRTIVQTLCSEE